MPLPTAGTPEADFATLCDLNEESDDEIATALRRLLPEEVFSLGRATIDSADIQVTNVSSRINSIKAGREKAVDASGLSIQLMGEYIPGSVVGATVDQLLPTGGAAGDAFNSPLSFFVNGSLSFGEAQNTDNETGQTFSTHGLTVGADYRIDENRVIGAAIGLAQNTGDFIDDGGNTRLDGRYISLFGTWYSQNQAYLDGVLEFGHNNYALYRRINLGIDADSASSLTDTTADQFAIGDTNANSFALTLGAGYDFDYGDTQFGPYGRLSITSAKVGGFKEQASNPENPGVGYLLNINSHRVRSASLALGGQVSKTYGTKRGVVVSQIRLEAQFEADDRTDGVTAVFQQDPLQTPFGIDGDETDSVVFNYGVGASAVFREGWSGFLFYEGQAGNDNVVQYAVKGGVRVEF